MLWFVKKKQTSSISDVVCLPSIIFLGMLPDFLDGSHEMGVKFVLRWARWAPLIPFPTLRILADRNWEWFLMEPKHHLCFVSVIGQTPRAIILWQHHGWFLRQPTPHIKLFPHIKSHVNSLRSWRVAIQNSWQFCIACWFPKPNILISKTATTTNL